ncbi:MAG: Polyribonucleotide nucleotidyltransferase [Candidatus Amesbacteria bacterium GW2011_GWC2_47_8]|uniref:Polyribonucleotide nucleotidyltransferase n=5 Tax=Candidatus Amesiibacteriota TaxID=1752730 RepID=A0A0G1TQ42_9BACT|nr:MAG: Polyribonucleotide nucleotidyltransferase [Candidatus Amesbacteria bacterium GW2011_GWC2_47_8]
MKIVSKTLELAGRTLTLEVGRFASRATSAVFARYGDTTLLATVVLGKEDLKKDYFPLSVEYQERLYAGGRIKGSRWVKREGRPTDAEVLSARLTDRSIRPLFPKGLKNEVQVIITVLSVDTTNDADVLGLIATSAALAISPIPWNGPVSAVRMGLLDGKLVVNPENGNRSGADLDLVITNSESVIPMIEAGANQVPEDVVLEGLKTGFAQNKKIIALVNDLVKEVGHDKISFVPKDHNPELVSQVHKAAKDLKDEAEIEPLVSGFDPKDQAEVKEIVEELFSATFRKNILAGKRADGRKLDEIRPLLAEVGVLPRVHGSAIFQRGETQSLVVTTLGAPSLSQSLESAEGEDTKRYMCHYNFPPFSTGETGRMGSPGRREIGHGALAERALAPVIPAETDFPYAIRVVSEIMSSNGSTSMASTCGSTLSLMDAGVPIMAPVAGISIGLVDDQLLTDINGGEDHYGDMDFKVAGTEKGITAIQLDVKIPGLTLETCEEAFKRARIARMQILSTILKAIPEPRKQLSQYAPKIHVVTIPVDKIGELIGPGGKVIKKLMADFSVTIDVNDNGSVFVSGTDQDGVNGAIGWIGSLGQEAKPGEIYEGTVARIQPFGAFVNILPGKDGLVHVSQMAQGFVADPNTIVHEGDKVRVWVIEIDAQNRISLSMLFDAAGQPLVKAREPREARPMNRGPFRAPQRRDTRRRF